MLYSIMIPIANSALENYFKFNQEFVYSSTTERWTKMWSTPIRLIELDIFILNCFLSTFVSSRLNGCLDRLYIYFFVLILFLYLYHTAGCIVECNHPVILMYSWSPRVTFYEDGTKSSVIILSIVHYIVENYMKIACYMSHMKQINLCTSYHSFELPTFDLGIKSQTIFVDPWRSQSVISYRINSFLSVSYFN